MEELRASKIKALETKKDDKIKEIINLFSHKYKDIKNYYNDITQSNLNYIKQLKTEINGLRKNEDSDKRKLLAVQTENKQLSGPLEEVQKELCQLEQDKKRWEETKELKNKERNEITNLEKLLKELDLEYEIKLQNFKYLEKEKKILFEKYEDTMYDIHQKAGLKNLILEKKLCLAKERLEVKDCELNQV